MKNLIKSSLGFLLIGAICSVINESCRTTNAHATAASLYHAQNKYAAMFPLAPIGIKKADTVKVELTDKQRLFYEKYFLPQFKSLRDIIADQNLLLKSQSILLKSEGASNIALTEMMQQMRIRSIRNRDSLQRDKATDKERFDRLEKKYLDQQESQVRANSEQIYNLKNITDILVTLGAIMILVIVIMGILVYVLWKKIERFSKQLHNA